jgi:SpoVK/Ycf46/Vps4 family AAA+-type ATPase
MSNYFRVKSITNLDDLKVDDQLPESDYSHLSKTGKFLQFEYVRDKVEQKVEVTPGIWSIKDTGFGLRLVETSFTADNILEDFLSTEFIIERANAFFNKLNVYKKYGIDVPKRGIVLFGPPGGGKSEAIKKICKTYNNDKETCVIIWPTDKIEPHSVKEFIKTFEYKDVKKIILILEDLGGIEVDQVRIQSESSLLSLLDNQEKVFKLPILIIATTNYPEVFMGNLMNRPGRFDDKIEVPYPTGSQRRKLLEFFVKDEIISKEALELIENRKTEEFTPAHIKEIIIRAAIHDKSHEDVMLEIIEEIQLFKQAFEKRKSMGFRGGDD